MATLRQAEWRREFVELVRRCWAYARQFPKGQRKAAYIRCMRAKGHV